MKTLALVCLLGACGDNRVVPGFDSSFDDDQLRVFGDVKLLETVTTQTLIPGAEVCLDDVCQVTPAEATFVLTGPGAPHEATVTAHDADHLPTVIGVVGGTIGDRNLGSVFVLPQQVVTDSATAFGQDSAFDSRGMVLVLAQHFDTDPVAIEIDGITTSYLGDNGLPDPGRTTLSLGAGVVFFGVPPGEATIRSTTGTCNVNLDGWPGTSPGELRVPVLVGHVSIVHPYCVGH